MTTSQAGKRSLSPQLQRENIQEGARQKEHSRTVWKREPRREPKRTFQNILELRADIHGAESSVCEDCL